jgi:hypothetical protein
MNKRMFFWLMPLALAGGLCAVLRADESAPAAPENLQDAATQAWLLDQYTNVAKDADSSGVWAVYQAADIQKSQPPQNSIDYFQRMLYQTKSHAVQRAIRSKLVDLYRTIGRDDKAIEQLEALMTDSDQ